MSTDFTVFFRDSDFTVLSSSVSVCVYMFHEPWNKNQNKMELVRRVSKRGLLRVDVKKIEKNRRRKIKESIKRLKAYLAEIGKDHKHIKEGHEEINLKLTSLDSECEKLKEGTEAIALQNSENQKGLDLIFAILRSSAK